jgi:hypothetical protein
MIDNIHYIITVNEIKDVVFDKQDIIFERGSDIKLSYSQFRTLCSNNYLYIPVNISQGHNVSVKITLDDVLSVMKFVTTKNTLSKPFNPEEEFPD